MRRLIGYILLALVIASCGNKSGYFKMEGRFRNFNQGEFYVYSPDGGLDKIDTIRVSDGRFAYEIPVDVPMTLVIVYPNFSEQPVFAKPGAAVDINGDASHLKETKVKGTKDNELMTAFRLDNAEKTPPEVKEAAANFIKDNPESPASVYLLNKYFIQVPEPDYKRAVQLVGEMLKANPENIRAAQLKKQLEGIRTVSLNSTLPDFQAVDINGKKVGRDDLKSKLNIITTWATWNYDSQNIQRILFRNKKTYGGQLALLSICVDANVKSCRRIVERDSIQWGNICDGKIWETPLLAKLGLNTVPGNIVCDEKGKIIAANLNSEELKKKIESILK